MQLKNKRSMVFTGGHGGTTALTVIQVLRNDLASCGEVHWIGSRFAFEGEKELSIEARVFPSREIIFHHLISGRLQRRFSFWTIPSLLKIPIGLLHALNLLIKICPVLVFSFGGFSAFPVVLVAWLLRIPVIILEQTIVTGRANLITSHLAKKILLAREESRQYFNKNKCQVVGNPLMDKYFKETPKKQLNNPPSIFITGGSRGSVRLNDFIKSVLPILIKKYHVIHQTGNHDLKRFEDIKDNLPTGLKKHYEVVGQVEPDEMFNLYLKSDVVVSRAGANTVSEIVALKKPCLLIPIPWSYRNEQYQNALFAKNFGVARIILEEDLTKDLFFNELTYFITNWKLINQKLENKISPDMGSSERIVKIIKEEVECDLR